MRTFPVIRTERFLLKQITKDNATVLNGVFDDDQTRQYLPELYSLIDLDDGILYFISTFDTYTKKGEGYLWGIFLKSKLLGFIAVMDIPYKPTLFYALHPSYRSQGIMKECVTQVLNYISEFNKCSCIHSEVYRDNKASIRLLESLGFENTGFDEQKIFFSRIF